MFVFEADKNVEAKLFLSMIQNKKIKNFTG